MEKRGVLRGGEAASGAKEVERDPETFRPSSCEDDGSRGNEAMEVHGGAEGHV